MFVTITQESYHVTKDGKSLCATYTLTCASLSANAASSSANRPSFTLLDADTLDLFECIDDDCTGFDATRPVNITHKCVNSRGRATPMQAKWIKPDLVIISIQKFWYGIFTVLNTITRIIPISVFQTDHLNNIQSSWKATNLNAIIQVPQR